jgi:conjugative relaxase-like TrwC/TraI family protein
MVEADELRALLDGVDPLSGEALTVGVPDRKVRAVDVTFSAPKSVSVLWALGSGPVAETVMQAHAEAVATALGFLEEHASVARRQVNGVRGRVATEGLAVAGFVHRTSREGDPLLHSHCLTVNLTRRVEDGRVVALDCWPLYGWARAAGSVYQAELQRSLSLRLGVAWGPDRHNTREIDGFEAKQLRVFSKRSALIEAELQQMGAAGVVDPGVRARLDDVASLATRAPKEPGLTPNSLVDRWETEAAEAGLAVGRALERAVCFGAPDVEAPSFETLAGLLVDSDVGLCARSARFSEADVVEHLCAQAAGRLSLEEIRSATSRFLSSDAVVRLVPKAAGRGMGEWSTVAHRALEDRVVELVDHLTGRSRWPLADPDTLVAFEAGAVLGPDQREAVGVLCGEGGALRCVLAPAGFGKTAMVATAARVAAGAGRPVMGVATTAKAVAELDGAGVRSMTIAALRRVLDRDGPVGTGTVLVLDEVSQASTRDAETVLAAVSGCAEGELWILGDPRQGQPVLAGGLADHLAGMVVAGEVPGGVLVENRRQVAEEDREALRLLRDGRAEASQTIRTEHGWEHDCGSPAASRDGLADAAVADMGSKGAGNVAVLCVSHVDAEDLADRIRCRLTVDGVIHEPGLEGPGWAGPREFQAGDRILFHTRYAGRDSGIVNGTVATVDSVATTGLTVHLDTTR